MDYKNYIKDATRTESIIEKAETHEKAFLATLRTFILAAQAIDLFKRQIFYGKTIDEKKLNALFKEINDLSSLELDSETSNSNLNPRILHSILGLCTESGEALESLLTYKETGDFDAINFAEELGDINWYQAIALDETGLDLEKILEKNIAKLKQRFPEKFSKEKAIERDLSKERDILEG